jgi:hypothetical protein
MIELPINENELDKIISAMRFNDDSALYHKLWMYKMNYLNKQKTEKK